MKKRNICYLIAPRRPPGRDMSRNKTKKSICPTPNRPRTLSAIVIVTLPKSIQEGPKLFQKPSKIEPKWCQNRSKRDPKRAQVAQEVKVASPRASRRGAPPLSNNFWGATWEPKFYFYVKKFFKRGSGGLLERFLRVLKNDLNIGSC